MSAREIIAQIKDLPAQEQALVAAFFAEDRASLKRPKFSVGMEADGLPVIRANGGTITSQFVREIESLTP